jgi:hypothetical protein
MGPQKGGMIKLHRMIQMKSIRRLYPCPEDPFLDAILNRKRRFPIGKGYLMSPLFQLFTEAYGWVSRTRPLPVAKKMKNFHRLQTLLK